MFYTHRESDPESGYFEPNLVSSNQKELLIQTKFGFK